MVMDFPLSFCKKENVFQGLETLFIVGLLLLAAAVGGLLLSIFRRSRRRFWFSIILGLVGLGAISGPAIYTRIWQEIDLGPRERMVDGERHLSLTGWDGDSYQFLASKSDTALLQLANADVTDQTVTLLETWDRIRELDLNDSQITDVGLASLAKLKTLQVLRLRGTKISDVGFRSHLLSLPELKNLDIRSTSISAELVAEWKQAKPGRRAFQ